MDEDERMHYGVMGCFLVIAMVAASVAIGIALGVVWGFVSIAVCAFALLMRMMVVDKRKDER